MVIALLVLTHSWLGYSVKFRLHRDLTKWIS
jgi:hypothetical protein